MGVDTEIRFVPKHPMSNEMERKHAANLAAAIGADHFWIDRKAGQHCISLNGDAYAVHFAGRFYGVGYERGNWPVIRAVIQWLQLRLGATVWYGGDSGGAEEMVEMTPEKILAMDKHFAEHGHYPYQLYFGRNEHRPVCGFCTMPYVNTGGGGNQTFYHCLGCDHSMIMYPGGVFELERNEEFFAASKRLEESIKGKEDNP